MLSKRERLSREEFSRFFASGVRFHTPYLTLIYTPGDVFRASAVVSKKVAKKAHERNTIRRRLYAALYKEKQAGLLGVVVLVAKPGLASLPRLKQHEAVATVLGLRRK
jgi:ribonuclease P protein component